MTRYPQPYYPYYPPQPIQSTTHPLNWAVIGVGAVASAFIPVLNVNNGTFLLAIAGFIVGFAALFLRGPWYWPTLGLVLNGVAIVGTYAMQQHWLNELNDVLNGYP